MDSQFHHSTRFSNADLAPLMARSNRSALLRFGLQYTLLLMATAAVVLAPEYHWPLWISALGVGVIAVLVLAMFAIVHESGHNTAFDSKVLNRAVCWLGSLVILYSPTGFREFHFAHHRYTHHPERDPEISIGGKAAPSLDSSLFMYLAYLTGLPLLLYKLAWLVAASLGFWPAVWQRFLVFIPPRAQRQHAWEARAVLAFYLCLLSASLLWLPGILHLFLAIWLGHSLLAMYTFCEHTGLPESGDILERTRTTLTAPVIRWLFWNMPYHAEHHAYPAIPWHALPQLHALLAPELKVEQKGYLAFHGSVVGRLLRGKASPAKD